MKRIYSIAQILLCVIVLLFVAGAAFAAPVGKVTHVEGRVDVLKAGTTMAKPITLGTPVDVGDAFRAKTNSKAEITFLNDNILRIAPTTRVEIKEYMVQGDRSSHVMKLHRGKVQAISSKDFIKRVAAFAEGNKFEVHTPNAVAGIRSSNMIVFYQRGVTGVLFLTGRGYTFNPQIPSVIVPITAGNITFIQAPNTTPTTPTPVSNKEATKHVNAVQPTPKPELQESRDKKEDLLPGPVLKDAKAPAKDIGTSPDTDLKVSPGQQKSSGAGGVSPSASPTVSSSGAVSKPPPPPPPLPPPPPPPPDKKGGKKK